MSELQIQREGENTTLIKWKLSNFLTVAARNDPKKELKSDVFQLDSSDIKCYLTFRPTSPVAEEKNYSSIFLYVKDFVNKSSIELRYRFWIENELGEKIRETEESDRVFENDPVKNSWGYSKFANHGHLYASKHSFVKNDVIFLCARIVYKHFLSTEFNRKIWNCYKEGFTGECTLKVSGEELKIPKTLLVAHSKVFKAMFTSGMKEETTGVIEIENFDAKTIKALIEYLHKECVDDLSDVAVELFKAADKYSIKGLKKQCEESLVNSPNKDNLRDRLILAFTYNSEVLKTAVLDFIERSQDGVFTSIISSGDWFEFGVQNKEIASEIIKSVSEKLKIKY